MAGVGAGELPGHKGRILRVGPHQCDAGNGGRALIDTGYVAEVRQKTLPFPERMRSCLFLFRVLEAEL